jgi:pilus assembly protein CpaB
MTVVIFAILVGLGGAIVVRQQLRQLPQLAMSEPELLVQSVIVPTAAMDLAPGQTLTINEIALVSLSPERYESSPYYKKSFMRNPEQVNGRTIKHAIKKGDAFLPDDFYPGLGRPGIADRLQPGLRAVTVSIEDVGAVQGFAGPGSVVDVLFRSRSEGDRPEVTLTLLERVEVLALASSVVPGQQVELDKGGTVTLSVTPQQAKILKVVEGRGELSLTLRSEDDVDVLPFDLGTVEPLLGQSHRALTASEIALTTAATGTGHGGVGAMTNVVEKNVERVTLDDLIGMPITMPPRQMEIYLGPTKTVVEFGKTPDAGYQLLQKGGRIRTPIAQDPTPPRNSPNPQRQVQQPGTGRALVSANR